MQNKALNFEPAFLLSTASGNLFNVGAAPASAIGYSSTAPYALIKHIRMSNIDTSTPHVVSLYKGGTGGAVAGTQFQFGNVSIPAQSWVDWYAGSPGHRFDAADFLSGQADASSKVVITMEGEIGLS